MFVSGYSAFSPKDGGPGNDKMATRNLVVNKKLQKTFQKCFSLPNRLFFMLASVKKSIFSCQNYFFSRWNYFFSRCSVQHEKK
jgi:hypothetical protein